MFPSEDMAVVVRRESPVTFIGVADRIGRREEPRCFEGLDVLASEWPSAEGARNRDGSVHPRWVDAWRRLLELPPSQLAGALVERSEAADALRQVTPFAGVIDPRARWQIWRDVRPIAP
jgi:hypothetical protein